MNYDDHYRAGGFKAASTDWLLTHTDLPAYAQSLPAPATLLDVGCGDGEWSAVLSQWFQVTGIDLSEAGIASARQRQSQGPYPLEFRLGSALDLPAEERFDVLFARAPSYLNHPTHHPLLRENLRNHLRHCRRLYYIKYTKAPFERWVDSRFFAGFDTDPHAAPDSRWYYNDPVELESMLRTFCRATVTLAENYFVACLEPLAPAATAPHG